jgi:hypothetical protein
MRKTYGSTLATHAVILALSTLGCLPILAAENSVLLESFESGVDNVAPNSWGGRGTSGDCIWSSYTRSGPEDMCVTEGAKSLKVEIWNTEWWSSDYQVMLSPEASQKVMDALASTNVARYILRYDIVFPQAGGGGPVSWMNSPCFFGSWGEQVEASGSQTNRTMSIPLDLVTNAGLEGPNGDQIVLRFADNFDAVEDPFVGPIELYLDNIRLVDTYTPGAVPVTTLLQSFEQDIGGAADFTGWGGAVRTTYTQYTTTGPDDIRVTDGTHALQVDYTGAGTWHADFQIPFEGTMLADILKLDLPVEERPSRDQLARYTLRFDVTYPPQTDGAPTWFNITAHTLAEDFIYTLGRPGGADVGRKTYSIPLDQITWADWPEGKPVIMLIANGNWNEPGTTVWFDNFRIIDTGNVPAPTSFKITAIQPGPASGEYTLTWESQPGRSYAIKSSSDLKTWNDLVTDVPASAGTTTTQKITSSAQMLFLRVLQK